MAYPITPLRITREDNGAYRVSLGGLAIENLLRADGLSIEFVTIGNRSYPQVTLTLAPHAVSLDLDTELVGYLRALDEQAEPVAENA